MPTIVPTSDLIGSGFQLSTSTTPAIVNGQALYVMQDIDIISTDSTAIHVIVDSYRLQIDGHVYGAAYGVSAGSTNSGNYVFDIGATGVVRGDSNGEAIFAAAGSAPGTVMVLNNAGQLISGLDRAVSLEIAERISVNNTGTIVSNDSGSSFAQALYVNAGSSTVVNSGRIASSGVQALTIGNRDDVAALTISPSGNSHSTYIVNSGEISGAVSIFSRAYETTLSNSGSLTGGIFINPLSEGGSFRFHHSGSLVGDLGVVNSTTSFLNTGLVDGVVTLWTGHDTYNGLNGGRVTGLIDMGIGDDTIYVEDNAARVDGGADTDILFARSDVLDVSNVETIRLLGGGNFTVLASDAAELIQGNLGDNLLQGEGGDDTISGGAGDDEIQGGAGADNLNGGTGDDVINGGSENDTMAGGAGADILLGAAGEDDINGGAGDDVIDGGDNDDLLGGFSGNDTILGGGGADLLSGHEGNDSLDGGIANDTLNGGLGNDILEGGDGVDVLRGQAGNDTLAGGIGRDYLTGGQDADDFLFRSAAEAGLGADRDQIIDFEKGVDVMNLASLIDGALGFVGTGPFTAANQVRLIETVAGSTIVQINLDANLATVEGEIRVADVIGLTVDDFAL